MEMIERMKMGGVQASRVDPWTAGGTQAAPRGELQDEYDVS